MRMLVREMQPRDLPAVEAIFTALARGEPLADGSGLSHLLKQRRGPRVALVAVELPAKEGKDAKDRVLGYLAGEIRALEFGSPEAGWIIALGVDPTLAGQGVGKVLRDEAVRRFRELGARTIRTLVKKDDVRVLRFFRDAGFALGPYVELELELD